MMINDYNVDLRVLRLARIFIHSVRIFAYSSVSSSFICVFFCCCFSIKQPQHMYDKRSITSSTSDTNEAWAVHFFFQCFKAPVAAAEATAIAAIANSTHCHLWIIIANTQAARHTQNKTTQERKTDWKKEIKQTTYERSAD